MLRTAGLSLAIILLCCSLCVASDNPIAGKWACVSDDIHGAMLYWTLTVNETGGKLAGTLVDQEDWLLLVDPALTGNRFTFQVFVNNNCTILFTLKLDDGKLDGDFACAEVSGTMKCNHQPPAQHETVDLH